MTPMLQSPPFRRQNKPQALSAQIKALAHELGPGSKLPTFLELRDALGVSKTTLSAALAELENQNVITRRHGIGLFVSEWLNRCCVGLVCDYSFLRAAGHSPFWDLLVDAARRRAESRNESFELHFAQPSEEGKAPFQESLSNEIRAGRIHGVLMVGLNLNAAQWLEAHSIPHVAYAGPARYTVSTDGCEIIGVGTRALLAQGCQRLQCWRVLTPHRPLLIEESDQQLLTFREEVEKSGLFFEPGSVKDCLTESGAVLVTQTHEEQGFQMASQVFGRPRAIWPDGVVISDDLMTRGALAALRQLDVQVGRDVKIATLCNRGSTVLMGHENELTLVEIDPSALVQAMFGMLDPLMNGSEPPVHSITIGPHLVN